MKEKTMNYLPLAAIAICLPLASQAQDLLALPGPDGLNMWDTAGSGPATLKLQDIAGGQAGTCYSYSASAGTLTQSNQPIGCLNYLVLPPQNISTQEPPYAITGQIEFMEEPLNETYNGFKISGVSGVDYCGERDGCDEIFVRGVTNPDLLTPMIAAAQFGEKVRVTGPAIWHLESIDIVIDNID
ncbi:hypothetical protein [Loktanella sp. F6476L]|uniref:hypothetical protein n=1 Tax=Loktanella sp. F6476L TaxID=2926405 RepID=UPI001FF2D488|nr:hypothetical protein [Loktanella sp. F6476L]